MSHFGLFCPGGSNAAAKPTRLLEADCALPQAQRAHRAALGAAGGPAGAAPYPHLAGERLRDQSRRLMPGTGPVRASPAARSAVRKPLSPMPFANLSSEPDSAYFANRLSSRRSSAGCHTWLGCESSPGLHRWPCAGRNWTRAPWAPSWEWSTCSRAAYGVPPAS